MAPMPGIDLYLRSRLDIATSSHAAVRAERTTMPLTGRQLSRLVDRVGGAVDRCRTGEFDLFDVDQVLFRYPRAAKELWKFCSYLAVQTAAAIIQKEPPDDWWQRGAPRERN